ncbi:MAG TPA: DinB family protein [Anaerolineales bacterium]|nr:DinB family protein [Anaerolineales bacterium]
MPQFQTKEEILTALRFENARVTTAFVNVPSSQFFARTAEVWSVSDQVDHLIRSHKPIIKALKLPRLALKTLFGQAKRKSMTYLELRACYIDKLENGAVATGSFIPEQVQPIHEEDEKRNLLKRWESVSEDLAVQVEKCSDGDLDAYQLPHPVLGTLTIREILYFTIFHNLLHAGLSESREATP